MHFYLLQKSMQKYINSANCKTKNISGFVTANIKQTSTYQSILKNLFEKIFAKKLTAPQFTESLV